MTDTWAVAPPVLPNDPRALYPAEWFDAAGRDADAAELINLRHAYRPGMSCRLFEPATSARGRNAAAELARVRASAKALFDEIHLGRRAAFGEQGHGYSDWANFRWQAAKQSGTIGALRKITEDAKAASEAEDKKRYGGPIDGADTILTRDMLRYGNRP